MNIDEIKKSIYADTWEPLPNNAGSVIRVWFVFWVIFPQVAEVESDVYPAKLVARYHDAVYAFVDPEQEFGDAEKEEATQKAVAEAWSRISKELNAGVVNVNGELKPIVAVAPTSGVPKEFEGRLKKVDIHLL